MAAIYQMIDGRVHVEDNHPWPLWASDAVYAQSVLEARNCNELPMLERMKTQKSYGQLLHFP